MAGIRVTISDVTGTDRNAAELPHDVPMQRLIPALLSKMGRPVIDQSGRPISYRMYFGDREIGADETLAEAGVTENATLILSQEAQAGRHCG